MSISSTVMVTAWSICCCVGVFYFYPSNWCFQSCHRSVVAAESHKHNWRCIRQRFQGLCYLVACWLRHLLVFHRLYALTAGSRCQKMWRQSIWKRIYCNTSQHSVMKLSLQEHKSCCMSDMLQLPKWLSPVTPRPGLIGTLELNGGLVHERSDLAVVITLVFLPFYANRTTKCSLAGLP